MAQKSGSRSGSGTGAAKKKPAATTRSSSGTTKKPASGAKTQASGSRQTSSGSRQTAQRSGGTRSTSGRSPASGQRQPVPRAWYQRTATKELARRIGIAVLLAFGIVGVISWFTDNGSLLESYKKLLGGLTGWGYYISPAAFLWAMSSLWLRRGRPTKARVISALLLPLVFGAFIHVAFFKGSYEDKTFSEFMKALFQDNVLKNLWGDGIYLSTKCGGVFAGLLGILLQKTISKVGAFVVLVLAFILLAAQAADISPLELWELIREQIRLWNEEDETDEDEEEDLFLPAPEPEPALPKRGKKKPAPEPEPASVTRRRPEQKPAEKREEPVRRRVYDEDWEKQKDRIFADMGIDRGAAVRVAAAIEDERKAASAGAGKRRVRSKSGGGAEDTPPRTTTQKPAVDMDSVKPLSMEEAAGIAGVELQSANMDAGAAGPMGKKEKIDTAAEAASVAAEIASAEDERPAYIFPEMSLLNKSDPRQSQADGLDDENEVRLEGAIRSFGVGATITGSIHGPTVTRYELRLDQGVKLSKITNLQDDIALSIGVTSVRIAPIPNKISTVGVEIPNREKATVWLGDVIDSEPFRNAKSKLSVALGKDIGGNVIVSNIAKMPHILIAGTTGSGKSVCINSLILSILYKSTPEEVRMIMVDPKQVELGIYNGMPHLYVPVVTDAKKAAGALQWSVVEMLKRYRLFSEVGVRDLAGYNDVLTANEQPILPRVVIIIDELADLMMVAAKEVEESICRLAQMGRAAGMHLVVATQSPRADVITGLMKANIPSRIAFAVSGPLESRIIMDQQGAEKLLGQGDMLYKPIGVNKPLRVQGAFVTDEEREEIINFVKREAEAEYSDEILAEIEKAAVKDDKKGGKGDDAEDDRPQNDYDELLPQAVDVIFETKQASVSMLQRRLKLGYSRAARLVDQLEEVGVVGPYEGSKPRQILLTKQQWQEMQYSQGTAPVDTIAQEFASVSESDVFAADSASDEDDDELGIPADAAGDDAPWDDEEDEP